MMFPFLKAVVFRGYRKGTPDINGLIKTQFLLDYSANGES